MVALLSLKPIWRFVYFSYISPLWIWIPMHEPFRVTATFGLFYSSYTPEPTPLFVFGSIAQWARIVWKLFNCYWQNCHKSISLCLCAEFWKSFNALQVLIHNKLNSLKPFRKPFYFKLLKWFRKLVCTKFYAKILK